MKFEAYDFNGKMNATVEASTLEELAEKVTMFGYDNFASAYVDFANQRVEVGEMVWYNGLLNDDEEVVFRDDYEEKPAGMFDVYVCGEEKSVEVFTPSSLEVMKEKVETLNSMNYVTVKVNMLSRRMYVGSTALLRV